MRLNRAISLLAVAMVLFGCSDSSVVDVAGEASQPISFSTSTRAVVDQNKVGMEDFLVWGGTADVVLFDATVVNPAGGYAGNKYWITGKSHSFYAFHPSRLAAECKSGVFSLKGFDSSANTGKDVIDIMTASATGLTASQGVAPQPVGLQFKHELTRVLFKVSTDEKVRITNVSLTGLGYIGDFSSTSAEAWKITGNSVAETFKNSDSDLAVGAELEFFGGDLLLIPQTLSKDCIFNMTWTYENGTSQSVSVPLPTVGVPRWEKGLSYLYSAVIPPHNSEVKFTVRVGDWNRKKINVTL